MSQSHNNRSNKSIIRKLTFIQVKRTLYVLLCINFVCILVSALAILFWLEWQAAAISRNIELQSGSGISITSSVDISGVAYGLLIEDTAAETFNIPQGSYRSINFSDLEPSNIRNYYEPERYNNIHYIASVPTGNGDFYIIRLDLGSPAYLMGIVFAVVLLAELWYVLWTIISARQSVKKALQPLYDLTTTAQYITEYQPIILDGTIDALNAINEEHLDKRILIQDEREELQGLATAINSMLDRLNAAYKSQLRFVSDASHELRTPIAIIQGYANLLARWGKDDPKTLQESVEAIKTEAINMQALIEQLLFLARSDNRSIPLRKSAVNISELALEVAKETQMIVVNHQIEEKVIPNLYVLADLQLIKQAMRILVDNAIKYSPDGGKIVLSVFDDNDTVQIGVSDNGIGIGEEDLANLFERFWRADESRARKTGGTGLGLSIAKWIADSHQGQIQVTSRKGIGTKMSIILPAAKEKDIPKPAALLDEEENEASKKAVDF